MAKESMKNCQGDGMGSQRVRTETVLDALRAKLKDTGTTSITHPKYCTKKFETRCASAENLSYGTLAKGIKLFYCI